MIPASLLIAAFFFPIFFSEFDRGLLSFAEMLTILLVMFVISYIAILGFFIKSQKKKCTLYVLTNRRAITFPAYPRPGAALGAAPGRERDRRSG